MSNLEGLTDPAGQAPVADGQGEVPASTIDTPTDSVPAESPPAEPELLDLSEIGDKHVTIKQDGEELHVPLSEALQGYQRQSDYTRKTQELAEQRQQVEEALRLQQALQTDPGLTVQALARRQGISVQEFLNLNPGLQNASPAPAPQFEDPLEQQLYEERQARQALEQRFEQREAEAQLMSAIDGLKQQFSASDEQVREVVGAAMQSNMGPQQFPLIFQAIAYQKAQAAAEVHQQAAQADADDDAARQAAAAAATAVVDTTPSSAAAGGELPPSGTPSLREAFESAYDQVVAKR